MNMLDRDDLRLVVLDLEASALAPGSYPIEVGIAIIEGAARPIQTWSTLIEPTLDWRHHGLWSPQSAAVHGITMEELEREGQPVETVCDRLNVLLRPAAAVVTDAPMFDQAWLDRLFAAASCEQQFIIYDFERLAGCLNRDDYRQFVHLLERSAAPHRAASDALRLASAVLEARIGYRPQTVAIERLEISRRASILIWDPTKPRAGGCRRQPSRSRYASGRGGPSTKPKPSH